MSLFKLKTGTPPSEYDIHVAQSHCRLTYSWDVARQNATKDIEANYLFCVFDKEHAFFTGRSHRAHLALLSRARGAIFSGSFRLNAAWGLSYRFIFSDIGVARTERGAGGCPVSLPDVSRDGDVTVDSRD